jgi:RNA recognition motif-containing protein
MFKRSSSILSSSFRVRVSGLPASFQPSSVQSLFSGLGATECIPVTTESGKELGQALISFPSVENAMEACLQFNDSYFGTTKSSPCYRKLQVSCDFRGPRVVTGRSLPREPNPRRLIKLVRDKAVGAKWPTDPVMASTNESRMLRRYKTGGLPRAHDRQR